jgi:hypothetical protein
LEKATLPAPWFEYDQYGILGVCAESSDHLVVMGDNADESEAEYARIGLALELIALARNALPSLLAEVRAARASRASRDAQGTTDRYDEGRRAGLREAAERLAGWWDDGDQGPPRSEIEQYAEIVLLRLAAAAPVSASAPPLPDREEWLRGAIRVLADHGVPADECYDLAKRLWVAVGSDQNRPPPHDGGKDEGGER